MRPIYYWLTRDKGKYGYELWDFKSKVKYKESNIWDTSGTPYGRVNKFCVSLWHKFTGIRLCKGTKVKVKVTKLKDGFKMELVNKKTKK